MNTELRSRAFAFRATACHMASYWILGMLAYSLLDYKARFESSVYAQFMRPLDSPWYAAGPALQIFRGVLLAAALYPFRRVLLDEPRGWLKLFGLLVALCVLSTSGAAPGSLEGVTAYRK